MGWFSKSEAVAVAAEPAVDPLEELRREQRKLKASLGEIAKTIRAHRAKHGIQTDALEQPRTGSHAAICEYRELIFRRNRLLSRFAVVNDELGHLLVPTWSKNP
jgi:hypothetical protein